MSCEYGIKLYTIDGGIIDTFYCQFNYYDYTGNSFTKYNYCNDCDNKISYGVNLYRVKYTLSKTIKKNKKASKVEDSLLLPTLQEHEGFCLKFSINLFEIYIYSETNIWNNFNRESSYNDILKTISIPLILNLPDIISKSYEVGKENGKDYIRDALKNILEIKECHHDIRY